MPCKQVGLWHRWVATFSSWRCPGEPISKFGKYSRRPPRRKRSAVTPKWRKYFWRSKAMRIA